MTGVDTDVDTTGEPMRYKTGRVIEEYDLDGADAALVERWTGADDERDSLRDLADAFNRWVLRTAMEEAGMNPLDGEVGNIYRLLTGEVSGGERVRARKRLEREGVDVDALEAAFVTHQAIHTYLTKHHDIRPDSPDEDAQEESSVRTLRRLQNRLKAVGESTVEGLHSAGTFRIQEPTVVVDVRVTCEDCGTSYDLSDLLDRDGCRCDVRG